MKVTVLSGIRPAEISFNKYPFLVGDAIESIGYKYDLIDLSQKSIKKCQGCFSCWVKTPGECIIKDDSQEICRKIITSDILVLLSPIVFGGYSSCVKYSLDRIIPLISPFFARYNGEIHHLPRYEIYPRLLGIGIQKNQNEEEIQISSNLVVRNSINLHSPIVNSIVLKDSDTETVVKKMVIESLLMLEVPNYAK